MDYYTACLSLLSRYNGQRATDKQLAKLAKSFPISQLSTLERMLTTRNISLPLKG